MHFKNFLKDWYEFACYLYEQRSNDMQFDIAEISKTAISRMILMPFTAEDMQKFLEKKKITTAKQNVDLWISNEKFEKLLLFTSGKGMQYKLNSEHRKLATRFLQEDRFLQYTISHMDEFIEWHKLTSIKKSHSPRSLNGKMAFTFTVKRLSEFIIDKFKVNANQSKSIIEAWKVDKKIINYRGNQWKFSRDVFEPSIKKEMHDTSVEINDREPKDLCVESNNITIKKKLKIDEPVDEEKCNEKEAPKVLSNDQVQLLLKTDIEFFRAQYASIKDDFTTRERDDLFQILSEICIGLINNTIATQSYIDFSSIIEKIRSRQKISSQDEKKELVKILAQVADKEEAIKILARWKDTK